MNAQATSNHEYAKGEYAIISDGLAPSKQVSLAARGEGELGDGDFHVWLMAEPAHRRIAALDGISSHNNPRHRGGRLSRLLVGGFPVCRRRPPLQPTRGRARSLSDRWSTGPSGRGSEPVQGGDGRDVIEDDDLRGSNSIVEWHGGNRFRLREFRSFVVSSDHLESCSALTAASRKNSMAAGCMSSSSPSRVRAVGRRPRPRHRSQAG